MSEKIMSIKNLTRSFKLESGVQQILKGISFDIQKGDFTVIMGASGSGKSTLLYAVSGMDKPTSGEIVFAGEDMTKLSSDELAVFRRKHCGFVFQQICLIDSLSVIDNVMAAGLLVSKNKKKLYAKACELLKTVGVEEHTWAKFPSQISGGRAQRVGIVRALVNNPEILFADEPTGALNSQTGTEVLDLLTDFNNKGQSIIMVTHDVRSAIRANRVLYLKDGIILDECILGKFDGHNEERTDKLTEFLRRMEW